MKKLLILVGLTLFLDLSVLAEVDIQALCKTQKEKVDGMVNTIASIHDQSIRDWISQDWIEPIIGGINKQSTSKKIDGVLAFKIYYTSGLTIAFKKVDGRLQEAQKKYDALLDFEKDKLRDSLRGTPHEPMLKKAYDFSLGKEGDKWRLNPAYYCYKGNYFSSDFSTDDLFVIDDDPYQEYTTNEDSDNQTTDYQDIEYIESQTIGYQTQQSRDNIEECFYTPEFDYTPNKLHQYLQKYVDCAQVIKEGETIKLTDKVKKFFDENKLWRYTPQELADLILEILFQLEYSGYVSYTPYGSHNWVQTIASLYNCGGNLVKGLHKNITLKEAFAEIKTAVYALSPINYSSVMEWLVYFKALKMWHDNDEERDWHSYNPKIYQNSCIKKELVNKAEENLNYIMKFYANKLVKKANGSQNSPQKH